MKHKDHKKESIKSAWQQNRRKEQILIAYLFHRLTNHLNFLEFVSTQIPAYACVWKGAETNVKIYTSYKSTCSAVQKS